MKERLPKVHAGEMALSGAVTAAGTGLILLSKIAEGAGTESKMYTGTVFLVGGILGLIHQIKSGYNNNQENKRDNPA